MPAKMNSSIHFAQNFILHGVKYSIFVRISVFRIKIGRELEKTDQEFKVDKVYIWGGRRVGDFESNTETPPGCPMI